VPEMDSADEGFLHEDFQPVAALIFHGEEMASGCGHLPEIRRLASSRFHR